MSLIKPRIYPFTGQTSMIPSHQLAGVPDLPALTDYLHQVMEHRAELLELRWPAKETEGFCSLILRAPGNNGEAKWSFYLASKLLWEYTSCDVLLIHNLINMASSKQGQVECGEALLATSQAYRNLTNRQDAYFIRTDVSTGTADAANMPQKAGLPESAAPKKIDVVAIESVMLKLRDPQTGLYTYPAFLYFLEQAYFQSCRTHAPISVALIEISSGTGKPSQLSKEQTFELVTTLTTAKRRTDMLAQYESDKLIVLAPATDHIGSKVFGRRLAQTLETTLSILFKKRMSFAVGLATLPKDGESMGMLLATAEAAKNHALNTGSLFFAHSDLEA
jgi:GGDEF domain-containing protein